MKLAIMQPYLFPYIGYFQLIRAVDSFVIYDDVNYIKGGWINRNYVLSRDNKQLITMPLKGASPNRLINQVQVAGRSEKLLRTLHHCYRKAPQFANVFPLLETILLSPEKNLARFLTEGLRLTCDYLDLRPRWQISSLLNKNSSLKGQAKVLAICEELGATHYINASGGRALYDRASFERRSVELSFIHSRAVHYHQFGGTFVSNLSIIDVLMFNDRSRCDELLSEYDIT